MASVKKGNIMNQYIQQTLKLVKGAGTEYIMEAAPTITELGRGIRDTSKIIANIPNSDVLSKVKKMNVQQSFKKINSWFLEKDVENEYDDLDLEFDIDTTSEEMVEAQISEMDRSSNKIAAATIGSAEQMVNAQIASTANIVTSIERMGSGLSSQLSDINSNLVSLMELIGKNSARSIQMQAADLSLKSQESKESFGANGKFSMSGWKQSIKSNLDKSELGMAASLVSMLGSGMPIGPDMVMGMLFEGIVDKKAPKLKSNLKVLDNIVNETIMASLVRLGESKDIGAIGTLSRLFGIDGGRKTISTEKAELKLEAVPYDSTSKEAITQVIPGYLKQIVTLLGGQGKDYDYKKREFRSEKDFIKDYREMSTEQIDKYAYRGSSGKKIQSIEMKNEDLRDALTKLLYNEVSNADTQVSRDTIGRMDAKSLDALFSKHLSGTNIKTEHGNDYQNFVRAIAGMTGDERMNMMNNLTQYNLSSSRTRQSYIDIQHTYGNTTKGIKDDKNADSEYILKGFKNNKGATFADSTMARESESGTEYGNNILFSIFRRLDKGINVFKVGEDVSIRGTRKFKSMKGVKAPAKKISSLKTMDDDPDTSAFKMGESSVEGDTTRPRLDDQFDENGNELTKGQAAGRWAKSSFGNFGKAMMSGNAGDVQSAFLQIIGDVGSLGKNTFITKMNDSFGNVTGYLKHQFMGSPYEYTDENGKIVKVAKNEKGGLIGYAKDSVGAFFFGEKNKDGKREGGMFGKASNYVNEVLAMFKGDKGEKGDVVNKRKKFISTAMGAVVGGGLLGGPLGMIVGGLAGTAFQTIGVGDKLKSFLFGSEDENGNRKLGFLEKATNKLLDPIRFAAGKAMHSIGESLKKNIFGPLSDLGHALIHRVTKPLGDMTKKILGGLGKGLMAVLTLPFKMASMPFRAGAKVASEGVKAGSGVVGFGINRLTDFITGGKQNKELREEIKQRRADRKEQFKDDDNEYNQGDGLFNRIFKGGKSDYQKWKEQKDLERTKRGRKLSDYLSEEKSAPITKEEWEAEQVIARENAENISRLADEKRLDKESEYYDNANEEGSIYVHDQTVHEMLTEMLDIMRGGNSQSSSKTYKSKTRSTSSTVSTNVHEKEDISKDSNPFNFVIGDGFLSMPTSMSTVARREKKKDDNDRDDKLISTIEGMKPKEDNGMGAMAALGGIVGQDGITSTEATELVNLQDESSKDKPNKSRIKGLFNRILRRNVGESEKKESFFSKLLSGAGGLLSGLFSFITSPGGIITAILAGLGLSGNLDLGSIISGVGKIVDTIGPPLANLVMTVGPPLVDLAANLLPKLISGVGKVVGFFTKEHEKGTTEHAVIDATEKAGGTLALNVGAGLTSLGNKLITSGASNIANAGGASTSLLSKIASKTPFLKNFVTHADDVAAAVKTTGTFGAKFADEVTAQNASRLSGIAQKITGAFKTVGSKLGGVATKAGSAISGSIGALATKYPKLQAVLNFMDDFLIKISSKIDDIKPIMNKIDDLVKKAAEKIAGIDFLQKMKGKVKIKAGEIAKKAGKALAVIGVILEIYSAAVNYIDNSNDPVLVELSNQIATGSIITKIVAVFQSIIYMLQTDTKGGVYALMEIALTGVGTALVDMLTPVGLIKLVVALCEIIFTWIGNMIGGSVGKFLINLASGCSDLLDFAADAIALGVDLATLQVQFFPELINSLATGDFTFFKEKLSSIVSNMRSMFGAAAGGLTKVAGTAGVGIAQGAANAGTRAWQFLGNIGSGFTDLTGITSGARDKWNQDMNSTIDGMNSSFGGAYDAVNNAGDTANNFISGKGSSRFRGRGNLYSLFNQYNPRYTGTGMAESGCGPTALSLAMNQSGINIDPGVVNSLLRQQGSLDNSGIDSNQLAKSASSLGYDMEVSNNNKDQFIKQLKGNKPAVLLGHGNAFDTDSNEYHYMTANGLDKDGNVIVTNPFSGVPEKMKMSSLLAATRDIIYPKGRGEVPDEETANNKITQDKNSNNKVTKVDETSSGTNSNAPMTFGSFIGEAFKIIKDLSSKIGKFFFGDLLGGSDKESDIFQENGESKYNPESATSDRADIPLYSGGDIAPDDWADLPDWNPDIGKGFKYWDKKRAFVEHVAPLMIKDFDYHHILPSFNLAQALMEGTYTGDEPGKNNPVGSALTKASTVFRNIFGMDTGKEQDEHIAFANWKDNVFAHGALLNRKEGYNRVVGEKNINSAIDTFDFGLYQWGRSGYNANYIDMMRQFVNKLGLTKYDQGLDWSSPPKQKSDIGQTSGGNILDKDGNVIPPEKLAQMSEEEILALGHGPIKIPNVDGLPTGSGRKGRGRRSGYRGRGDSNTNTSPGNVMSEMMGILSKTASNISNFLFGDSGGYAKVDQTNFESGTDYQNPADASKSKIDPTQKFPANVPGSDAAYLSSSLQLPISFDFGARDPTYYPNPPGHAGVDISTRGQIGKPIPTPVNGTILLARHVDGWGNQVLVKSDKDGTIHSFNHLNAFNVNVGDKVKRGDVIGYSGNTGRSSGPHLDYTIGGPGTWNGSWFNYTTDIINPHNISHASDATPTSSGQISPDGLGRGQSKIINMPNISKTTGSGSRGRGETNFDNDFKFDDITKPVDEIDGKGGPVNTTTPAPSTNMSNDELVTLLKLAVTQLEHINTNTTPIKGKGENVNRSTSTDPRKLYDKPSPKAFLPFNEGTFKNVMSLARGY